MVNPFVRKKSDDENFKQSLFYFIREFKLNPFDEEYDVVYKNNKIVKIIKKGVPIPMMNILVKEMESHYKREEQAMKRGRR